MSSGMATATPGSVALHDIDWSPVVRSVIWVPAAYRCGTLDENRVLRILRCTPASLAALRDLGLTPQDKREGPRYDACDIRNAALYSMSDRTEVEAAMRPILSFLRGPDEVLFAERRWTYQMRPVAEPGTGMCLTYPLAPEVSGGETEALTVDGAPPRRAGDRVAVPAGSLLRGTIVTRGRPGRPLNPLILSITADFLASGVRWHYLPEGLKTDAHAACAAGVGNCDTLSAVLAERLTAAGFATSIYRGWIIGITEVPHSWIEVTDDDGDLKVIDPSLLLLASHSSLGSPDFAARALGARLSRVAPTRCPLTEPIGVAMTPDGTVPCQVGFSCRPSRPPGAAKEGRR